MTSDRESSFDALLRDAAELRVPANVPPHLPDLGELLQEKYRIEELLGQGGMGAVFRATHVESGKQVAIKWLLGHSPRAALRFAREAQIAAQIDHPNVVNVFDVGSHRGGRFLVMELLRGESLGARIRRGRIPAAELIAIMIPVLRGVAAAHRVGVVHRDLKPDNVFLCVGPDGSAREPKVLDFGISKLLTTTPLDQRLTDQGTSIGTVTYMSPQQLVDAPNVDELTDIYAAGALMYEALTGRLPFRAECHNALVLAIAAQRPVPISTLVSDVPARLERIVLRALAKEPHERQPDVPSLIRELEACFVQGPSSAPEPRANAAADLGRKRQRWSLAAWAALPLAVSLWFATHPPALRHKPQYGARITQQGTASAVTSPLIEPTHRSPLATSPSPGMAASAGPERQRVPELASPSALRGKPPSALKLARVPARSRAGDIRMSDL